jgi:bifunctional UDP-N-acetylglucosamine pyrophosphorylase/glucosamine-1-phosphate N-acetyltransferase
MFLYTLDLVKKYKAKHIIAVLGHKHKMLKEYLPGGIKVVIQKRLLGTADAVRCTNRFLKAFKGTVLVLYADHPLFKEETIRKLIKHHLRNNCDVTLLTAKTYNPAGYGRILRDEYGNICGIIEENQANEFQKEIKEVNLGAICFNRRYLFKVLRQVKQDSRKKEYYLTQAIKLLYKQGALIESVKIANLDEAMGINCYSDLVKANQFMRKKICENLTNQEVKIVDPGSTFIDWDVKIGKHTVIYPFTIIDSGVKIGKYCSIGPFCHLRPGTTIKDKSQIGNFSELVRSKVGNRTRIKHFSYIGDARIGQDVNIGAGTVTANFDGKKKNITIIKDRAFIGSDTVLVAPVKIGKSAVTGAGCAVTKNKNVPDGKVVTGVPARILNKRGK